MNEQSSFNSSAPATPVAGVDLSKAAPATAAPAAAAPAIAANETSVAPASSPATGASPVETEVSPEEALVAARGKGASWFFWIVGLSIVNTVIALFGSDSGFPLGLASTLMSDIMAGESIKEGGPGIARLIALFFDGIVFAFYAMCGVMALRGATWAFVLGLVFFTLDTLIMMAVQEWLGVALHVWALVSIWMGMSANNRLKKLRLAQAQAAAPNPWSG